MNKLTTTLLTGVLAAAVTSHTIASEAKPFSQHSAFSAYETASLFESGFKQSNQLAALSAQEMQDTEGAVIPLIYGGLMAANYASMAFRASGIAMGAYRMIGPAYRGGRVFQVMKDNRPVFRLDNHLVKSNPNIPKLHFHSAPDMKLHRSVVRPWRSF